MLSDSAILLVYRGSVILSQTAVDALSTRQFTQSTLGCRGNQMVPAISPNGFSPSAVRPCISAASFAASMGSLDNVVNERPLRPAQDLSDLSVVG